ncbi:MAG: deoxyribodipyrimidine photolyase [Planctomycetia bacterium]|nr:deoxyribodipyrimidine photolyase [Planctomycetia bacterium]
MHDFNDTRVRRANAAPVRTDGDYVLYWMQLYRRLSHNHALDCAAQWAARLGKSLVVYEGLKLGYPWASQRLHQFILEGMRDNAAAAKKLGLNYWPFVETPAQPGRGLLRKLAERACAIVTDDFPCFIVPEQTAALAAQCAVPVVAVDGNCVIPLALLGEPVSAAAHLRHRLHRGFLAAWQHRATAKPRYPTAVLKRVEPPFDLWSTDDSNAFIKSLPLDASVPPVSGRVGGSMAARKCLRQFIRQRLAGYAERRSSPAPPEAGHGSGLSPYLHFGHISIEEVVAQVLATVDWTPDDLDPRCRGKREGFYCRDADVNAFLDEALTWRDVGFHWHWHRRQDTATLEQALPAWALATLRKHASDRREHLYTLDEWESGQTHDPLWNAAQRELVATGQIHNYLRMLWGKKVLEWSATPDEAYRTLVHLNNKYALDGRNPNSWTGILWCFGLFDRPWPPERPVLGTVRYMSSENTAKKFRLGNYLAYVEGLPTIAEVRSGPAARPARRRAPG